MRTTPSPLTRRLAAMTALVALPLAAAVGCGKAADSKKASVQDTLQKAADNLQASGAASFTLHLDDPAGKLKRSATSATTSPLTAGQADALLGGTVTVTYDPVAGKTLADVQKLPATTPLADRLKSVNVAMSVKADGGSVAEVRLVDGDLYARVGLDTISDLAKKGGSSGIDGQIEQFASSAPAQLAPLVADVRAGRWLKLPLAPYAPQLDALLKAQPSATPGATSGLVAAVTPFVTVTDAGSKDGADVLDVTVQAKQALKAVAGSIAAMTAGLPGASSLNTAQLDGLGDGTVDGQVFLKDDHLTRMTLDLGSAVRLRPASASPAPDVAGSLLTLDVDDSADEVTAPTDVSSADVASLVQQALAAFGGGQNATG